MNDERRIEDEIEVPVSPEEAWEAIATRAGITAWFMPAEVEPGVGGSVTVHPADDMASVGRVVAYDPPHRFAYEESNDEFAPSGTNLVTTEFLIEAASGGTCVVRVVMSGFGEGDAWDAAIESYTAGWRQALLSLRLYLTHFAGEPMASITVGRMVAPDDSVWWRLRDALGLPSEPATGERIATNRPDAPVVSGVVEGVGDGMVTILLDEPAPGVGLIGAGGGGDKAFATVRAQLFGPEAEAIAARQQKAWNTWMDDLFAS